MKKSAFKVLCLVLIIALLAPNVSAATPAPEAPLADAATVARVKQEIAAGEITDMEDVFLVAYQHLGANINEDGMTAYINADGTLGIAQIIRNPSANGDVSLCATNNDTAEISYIVSTLGVFNTENSAYAYNPTADIVSTAVDGTLFVISHTAYYNGQIVPGPYDDEEADDDWQIRLNYMVTNIYGASPPYYVSKIVQHYAYKFDGQEYHEDTKTTTGNLSGAYSFTPATRDWYPVPSFRYDALFSSSTVYISGIAEPIVLDILVSLYESIPF